jgi:hypothetical protein
MWEKKKIEMYVKMNNMKIRIFNYEKIVLKVVNMKINKILENRKVVIG